MSLELYELTTLYDRSIRAGTSIPVAQGGVDVIGVEIDHLGTRDIPRTCVLLTLPHGHQDLVVP